MYFMHQLKILHPHMFYQPNATTVEDGLKQQNSSEGHTGPKVYPTKIAM